MNHTILPVEAIQERDIDLILLEELSTDNAFCEWFIRELSLPELITPNGAWRSITAFGLGETDLLFSYQSIKKKVLLLIENKLDATFQYEQFNRYLNRGEEYVRQKECDEAFVVLIAPELYCENQSDFENYVTYESIIERFEFVGTKRKLFKSKLLRIAIEKLRRGYQPVNSIPVQQFWHSYWKFKEENYPSLDMKKPDIVPFGSDWPMLYDANLKNVTFVHKLAQGNIDATFSKFSEEIEFKIKDSIPDWAIFIKHRKTFSIRIFTGKIDRVNSFNDQIKMVENGLQNINKLRHWIIRNQNTRY